jgi:hypothetical protein
MTEAPQPNSRQRKILERLSKALVGEHVRWYEVGRANFRWTTAATIMVSLFAALFVAGLLAHVVIFPGALLIIAFVTVVRPLRFVIVTDRGVIVMARGYWGGKPGTVIASSAHGVLLPPHVNQSHLTRSGPKEVVNFGPEQVTIARKRFNRLVAAIPAEASSFGGMPHGSYGAPGSVGGPPPGWYPDPSQQHHSRYWDGAQWTEQVQTDPAAPQPT